MIDQNADAFKPLARLGPMDSLEVTTSKKNADAINYKYRVTYKGIALWAHCSLSSKGKILTFRSFQLTDFAWHHLLLDGQMK